MQTLPRPSGNLAISSKCESNLDGLQGFYVQYFSNSSIPHCRQGGYRGGGSELLMGQSGIGGKEAWSFRNFLSPSMTLSLGGGVVAWRMRRALTWDIEHFIKVSGLGRCVLTAVMLTAAQKSLQPLTPHTPTHCSLLDFTAAWDRFPRGQHWVDHTPLSPKAFLVEPRVQLFPDSHLGWTNIQK